MFRQVLLKVHSRCNLACDYCYVYEHADQSWREQPRIMARATVERAAARIGEHVAAHGLSSVTVILHGGEPLLAGVGFLRETARTVRARVPAEVSLHLQTNGVLLTEAALDMCAAEGIRVGVSLDGTAASHDRHRRFPGGRGSHAHVARGLRLLGEPRFRDVYGGILCAVDVTADPLATYAELLSHRPPAIDLLLPLGNWDSRPPHRGPDPRRTPYADWLAAVFDRWYDAPRQETSIRLFEAIISLLLGGPSTSEAVGPAPSDLIVIETDGSLQQSDALKTVAAGAPATGLHIDADPLDAALAHPGIQARRRGRAGLAEACRRCPIVSACGGGLYAHRYGRGRGFDNPSVYCPDLLRLIGHIRGRVQQRVAAIISGTAERA